MSAAGEASPVTPFGDRLARAVAERESQVVLGIDPDPAKLWPDAVDALAESRARLAMALADVERSAALDLGEGGRAPRLEAAAAVLGHCLALIDAAGPACVAAKPQLACFERLGFPGWLALEATVVHARRQGLLVIADAKRGDIAASAARVRAGGVRRARHAVRPEPRARAPTPSRRTRCSAATRSPRSSTARAATAPACSSSCARRTRARPTCSTSSSASGGPLWERIAGLVAGAGTPGPESGLADVGAVTGATVPEHLARMRELMPHTPFLLPGIGAQGGSVADLAPAFAPGRAGGLVSASRSIAERPRERRREPARGRPRGGGAAPRAGLGAGLNAPPAPRAGRVDTCGSA